jgi:hypothetical protein
VFIYVLQVAARVSGSLAHDSYQQENSKRNTELSQDGHRRVLHSSKIERHLDCGESIYLDVCYFMQNDQALQKHHESRPAALFR